MGVVGAMGEQWNKHSVGCVPRSCARAGGTDGNTQEDRTEEQQEEQPRRNDLGGTTKDKCGRRGAYFFNMWV